MTHVYFFFYTFIYYGKKVCHCVYMEVRGQLSWNHKLSTFYMGCEDETQVTGLVASTPTC